LIEAVKSYAGHGIRGGVNWVKVSEYMNHTRSPKKCVERWEHTLKCRVQGNLLTTKWSSAEVLIVRVFKY
jgi:hypothetical protein